MWRARPRVIACSPRGDTVVCVDEDEGLSWYSLSTGGLVGHHGSAKKDSTRRVGCLAVSVAGVAFYCYEEGKTVYWADPAGPSGSWKFEGVRRGVTCLACHPVRPNLVIGTGDGVARMWQTKTMDLRYSLEESPSLTGDGLGGQGSAGAGSAVTAVAYHPRRDLVVTGTASGRVSLWGVAGNDAAVFLGSRAVSQKMDGLSASSSSLSAASAATATPSHHNHHHHSQHQHHHNEDAVVSVAFLTHPSVLVVLLRAGTACLLRLADATDGAPAVAAGGSCPYLMYASTLSPWSCLDSEMALARGPGDAGDSVVTDRSLVTISGIVASPTGRHLACISSPAAAGRRVNVYTVTDPLWPASLQALAAPAALAAEALISLPPPPPPSSSSSSSSSPSAAIIVPADTFFVNGASLWAFDTAEGSSRHVANLPAATRDRMPLRAVKVSYSALSKAGLVLFQAAALTQSQQPAQQRQRGFAGLFRPGDFGSDSAQLVPALDAAFFGPEHAHVAVLGESGSEATLLKTDEVSAGTSRGVGSPLGASASALFAGPPGSDYLLCECAELSKLVVASGDPLKARAAGPGLPLESPVERVLQVAHGPEGLVGVLTNLRVVLAQFAVSEPLASSFEVLATAAAAAFRLESSGGPRSSSGAPVVPPAFAHSVYFAGRSLLFTTDFHVRQLAEDGSCTMLCSVAEPKPVIGLALPDRLVLFTSSPSTGAASALVRAFALAGPLIEGEVAGLRRKKKALQRAKAPKPTILAAVEAAKKRVAAILTSYDVSRGVSVRALEGLSSAGFADAAFALALSSPHCTVLDRVRIAVSGDGMLAAALEAVEIEHLASPTYPLLTEGSDLCLAWEALAAGAKERSEWAVLRPCLKALRRDEELFDLACAAGDVKTLAALRDGAGTDPVLAHNAMIVLGLGLPPSLTIAPLDPGAHTVTSVTLAKPGACPLVRTDARASRGDPLDRDVRPLSLQVSLPEALGSAASAARSDENNNPGNHNEDGSYMGSGSFRMPAGGAGAGDGEPQLGGSMSSKRGSHKSLPPPPKKPTASSIFFGGGGDDSPAAAAATASSSSAAAGAAAPPPGDGLELDDEGFIVRKEDSGAPAWKQDDFSDSSDEREEKRRAIRVKIKTKEEVAAAEAKAGAAGASSPALLRLAMPLGLAPGSSRRQTFSMPPPSTAAGAAHREAVSSFLGLQGIPHGSGPAAAAASDPFAASQPLAFEPQSGSSFPRSASAEAFASPTPAFAINDPFSQPAATPAVEAAAAAALEPAVAPAAATAPFGFEDPFAAAAAAVERSSVSASDPFASSAPALAAFEPEPAAAAKPQQAPLPPPPASPKVSGSAPAPSTPPSEPLASAEMTQCLSDLENGAFAHALIHADEALRNLNGLETQATFAARYRVTLRLLLAIKQEESHPAAGGEPDRARTALLSQLLCALPIGTKHRLVCVKMAIKRNLDAGNYGVVSHLISFMLPRSKAAAAAALKEQLALCESNGLVNQSALPYVCPKCGASGQLPTELSCASCSHEVRFCWRSLTVIQGQQHFLECPNCHANFSARNQLDENGLCHSCHHVEPKEEALGK